MSEHDPNQGGEYDPTPAAENDINRATVHNNDQTPPARPYQPDGVSAVGTNEGDPKQLGDYDAKQAATDNAREQVEADHMTDPKHGGTGSEMNEYNVAIRMGCMLPPSFHIAVYPAQSDEDAGSRLVFISRYQDNVHRTVKMKLFADDLNLADDAFKMKFINPVVAHVVNGTPSEIGEDISSAL